nr:hypothetical protein [Tanacetum cinerariifolium]
MKAYLIIEGAVMEACLFTEGASLDACLVNEGITLNDNTVVMESSSTKSENSSSETPISRISSLEGNHAYADIGSSNDSSTVLE